MIHHKIAFDKIHACGNDFLLLSHIELQHAQVKNMCARHHGLGADGLMVFWGSDQSCVKLDHYDSDGSRSFCLNGIRASLACLHQKDQIPKQGQVHSEGVTLTYKIDNHVQLEMPAKPFSHLALEVGREIINGFFIDVGNPHFILLKGVASDQFERLAPALRRHNHFVHGANVSQVIKADNHYRIRTYERGVEGFTRACGSAMYATAIVLFKQTKEPAVLFMPDGQGLVRVAQSGENLTLEGPTHHVARGEWL